MRTYIGYQRFEGLNVLNEYIVKGNVVFDAEQHIRANDGINKFADISLGRIIPEGLRRSYLGTYGFVVVHPTVEISARVPCFSEEESKSVLEYIRQVAEEKGLSLRADTFSLGVIQPMIYHYEEISFK